MLVPPSLSRFSLAEPTPVAGKLRGGARARRTHTHTHRYFVIEKVKVEGGPDKFYATRLLKYYADKEAFASDPNSFKGCIQCSIKTPVKVEVGVVLSYCCSPHAHSGPMCAPCHILPVLQDKREESLDDGQKEVFPFYFTDMMAGQGATSHKGAERKMVRGAWGGGVCKCGGGVTQPRNLLRAHGGVCAGDNAAGAEQGGVGRAGC